MKNRKTFAGMAIFLAILVLGIGYAAVTGVELDLSGDVNVKANADFSVVYDTAHTVKLSTEEKIDWDEDENGEKEQAVVVGSYTDTDTATMTVYLDSANRTASAVYKIVNNSTELPATVSASVTSDFEETYKDYLSVTHALYTDEDCTTPLDADTQLAAQTGVAYLKVTVNLTKLPVNDITTARFTIQVSAEPAEIALGN